MKSRFSIPIALCMGVAVVQGSQETMLDSFTVNPALEATLWADNALIHAPLAIDADAQGRIWVVEDVSKSGVKGVHSRVKILEDTDNDGKADLSKVFGPTFSSKPMGLAVFDNVIVVSMAPNIHVYTDVNRDDKFDPKVDKHEIIAKGFHGHRHDHGLHAVVPGPSGKWYVNHGNIGADVTMSDGRTFHASSYYSHNPKSVGKKSHDGRVYVGGFGLRMNSDGSEAEVIFQNARNTHAMLVTSFGDVFQADNDDPTHCRAAWAMEHANFGYASLEDGNRSWEDAAKSWEKRVVTQELKNSAYERHGKSVLRRDDGHWREHFPGVTPPGNVWGPGGPTGDYMIEGDELGKEFRGRYLVCETVNRALFSFRPVLRDAQIEMVDLDKHFFTADRKSKNALTRKFMPTDVVANTDGSLYICDWNSGVNARGATNTMGGIFRLARKGSKVNPPKIDFSTVKGLLKALESPSPGVRWVAQDRLKKRKNVFGPLKAWSRKHDDNPYYQARAIFVMAQLKEAGAVEMVKGLLKSKNEQWRIVAFRALRHAGNVPLLELVKQCAGDKSAAVRREVLGAMRGMKFADVQEPLKTLVAGYDGKNRWYLEALGYVFDEFKDEAYKKIIKPTLGDNKSWNARAMDLAWRVRSEAALNDLGKSLMAQDVALETFRKYAYTYGLCYADEERKRNREWMLRFKKHPAFKGKGYQQTIQEFLEKEINDPDPIPLAHSYRIPKQFGNPTKLSSTAKIAKLKPNLNRGRMLSASCMMCHKIGSGGAPFGPDLTNWGQVRGVEEIITDLVNPSGKLAHGFEKPVVITQKGHTLEGVVTGYSYHAGAIKVKTMGGQNLKVSFRRPRAKIKYLKNHSWMPSASAMGLSDQDVRDITAYLMSDIASQIDTGITPEKAKAGKADADGWKDLFPNDSLKGWCSNQQGKGGYVFEKNWQLKDGVLSSNGSPVGILYSEKKYRNFEMKFDWMHEKSAGNSGLFIWIKKVGGRLAEGIEVQVLDPGYEQFYKKKHTDAGRPRWKGEKKWFTGHGDVFPVGKVKMTPFPPSAPEPREKSRSFPTENRTKPHGQWNSYHIKAINGVVRLSVNGKEVSGGYNISPAFGPMAFESEGSPVKFRNIKIKELPDNAKDSGLLTIAADKDEQWTLLSEGPIEKHWRKSGYSLKDGVIHGSNGRLYSKKEYDDFHLKFDFKLEPGGNNGLAIRTPLNQRPIELQILDSNHAKYKDIKNYQHHGSLYNYVPAKQEALKAAPAWNSQEVICKGNHVKVILNGTVIMEADLSKVKPITKDYLVPYINKAKKGHIGFLGHNSRVWFKNVRIKEL